MKTNNKDAALLDLWKDVAIGTPVVVKRDDGSFLQTYTRSTAWMLGGHTPVIMVDGVSGAYALSRVLVDGHRSPRQNP